MTKQYGTLFIVATPIGNLEDITLRAKRILSEVDFIAAEDTRHSKKLLQYLQMTTSLIPLHAHNEEQQIKKLISQLIAGKNIALISDAGTPTISDPGGRLVQYAHQAKMTVVPIPGPSALITALSIAGLPADSFYFAGFLSSKEGARRKSLEALKHSQETLVFYEAPHRIVECIHDMKIVFGENRHAVLCRELTKVYETTYVAKLEQMHAWLLANKEQQQGEFVVIIQGADISDEIDTEALRILTLLMNELPNKQAVNLASKITGVSKNKLYQLALQKFG